MLSNLRYADDITLMAESGEELKSLLTKVKEEWKCWFKIHHSENQDHGLRSHHFMANRWRNDGNSDRLYVLGDPKSLQIMIAAMKIKYAYSLEEKYDQPRQHIKKQRHYFVIKGTSSQGYVFSSSQVWMWELDYKES